MTFHEAVPLAVQAAITAVLIFAISRVLPWGDETVEEDAVDAVTFGVVFTLFSWWFRRRDSSRSSHG